MDNQLIAAIARLFEGYYITSAPRNSIDIQQNGAYLGNISIRRGVVLVYLGFAWAQKSGRSQWYEFDPCDPSFDPQGLIQFFKL